MEDFDADDIRLPSNLKADCKYFIRNHVLKIAKRTVNNNVLDLAIEYVVNYPDTGSSFHNEQRAFEIRKKIYDASESEQEYIELTSTVTKFYMIFYTGCQYIHAGFYWTSSTLMQIDPHFYIPSNKIPSVINQLNTTLRRCQNRDLN